MSGIGRTIAQQLGQIPTEVGKGVKQAIKDTATDTKQIAQQLPGQLGNKIIEQVTYPQESGTAESGSNQAGYAPHNSQSGAQSQADPVPPNVRKQQIRTRLEQLNQEIQQRAEERAEHEQQREEAWEKAQQKREKEAEERRQRWLAMLQTIGSKTQNALDNLLIGLRGTGEPGKKKH